MVPNCVQERERWFLVMVGMCATILGGTAIGAEAISVRSVRGVGAFTNDAALLVDGQMPPEQSSFDDPKCVHWSGQGTNFVFDLGKVFRVTGLTLQVDNDDNYVIQAGTDGENWTALLTIPSAVGEIDFGMDTLSAVAAVRSLNRPLHGAAVTVRYFGGVRRSVVWTAACHPLSRSSS